MDESVYEQLYAVEDRHWWFRGRRAVIWALLSSVGLPRPARLLDAGCGTGRNLREFAPLGELVGIDPAPQAVAACRSRGLDNVHEAPLEALPFEDASFDAVLAFDVLEHLDDDGAALRELRRVTRAGGALVATVPAYGWLWSHHDQTHHHKRRYLRGELTARARDNGWEPVRSTYFNSLLLPPIALVRALRKDRQNGRSDYELTRPRLDRLLERPMRIEASLIRRGASLPAGVSVGMVCVTA